MSELQSPKYAPVAVTHYSVTHWEVERTADHMVLRQPENGLPVAFLDRDRAQAMVDFLHAYGEQPDAFGLRVTPPKPELPPMHIDGPL